jgi:hypothetical protein
MKELKEVTEKQDVAGYMETQETVTSPLGEKLKEKLEEKRLQEEAADAGSGQASFPQDDHSLEQSEPDVTETDTSLPEKEPPVASDSEGETATEVEAETETEAGTEAETETKADVETETKTDIEIEPKKE